LRFPGPPSRNNTTVKPTHQQTTKFVRPELLSKSVHASALVAPHIMNVILVSLYRHHRIHQCLPDGKRRLAVQLDANAMVSSHSSLTRSQYCSIVGPCACLTRLAIQYSVFQYNTSCKNNLFLQLPNECVVHSCLTKPFH
jgi:hypothetical protein